MHTPSKCLSEAGKLSMMENEQCIFFPNLFESTTVCKIDGCCFTYTFRWIRRDMKTGFQLTPLQIFKRNVYNGVQRCYDKKLNANTCSIKMLVKHLPCRTR